MNTGNRVPSFQPTKPVTVHLVQGGTVEIAADDPSVLDPQGVMYEQDGLMQLLPWGQVARVTQPLG